jgi:cobalt transporter subunit CbtA
MFQRMLTSALIAGVAAGLLAAVLHFVFVQNYILLGEAFESGTRVHFAGTATGAADGGSHDHAPAEGDVADASADHDHTHEHPAPGTDASGLKRNALTVLFTTLVYSGYGLLLVAGFALANRFGHSVTAQDGVLWGLAGFAAFQLMPAMGLAPDLPGTLAADFQARQVWWLATVLCTGAALALIGYGSGLSAYGLAVLLLALPHIVGAPQLDGFSGVAPPEVAGAFSARVLGVGLIAWAVLGLVAGRLWTGKAA